MFTDLLNSRMLCHFNDFVLWKKQFYFSPFFLLFPFIMFESVINMKNRNLKSKKSMIITRRARNPEACSLRFLEYKEPIRIGKAFLIDCQKEIPPGLSCFQTDQDYFKRTLLKNGSMVWLAMELRENKR